VKKEQFGLAKRIAINGIASFAIGIIANSLRLGFAVATGIPL
jgi:hypothetical protein